jgi:hypothetical protein
VRSKNKVEDELLGFVPDVVIATGEGTKVNANKLAQSVKRRSGLTKLILLFPSNKINDDKYISQFTFDNLLETPVNPRTLVRLVSDISKLDTEAVLKKFDKLPIAKSVMADHNRQKNTSSYAAGNKIAVVKNSAEERKKNYQHILGKEDNPPDKGYDRAKVQEEIKEIRKYEKEHPELEEIDNERKKFVTALYKK